MFAIILPLTSIQGAMIIAESLRAEVERHFAGQERPLTVSTGVCEQMKDEYPGTTFQRADNALKLAKQRGANQDGCFRSHGLRLGGDPFLQLTDAGARPPRPTRGPDRRCWRAADAVPQLSSLRTFPQIATSAICRASSSRLLAGPGFAGLCIGLLNTVLARAPWSRT